MKNVFENFRNFNESSQIVKKEILKKIESALENEKKNKARNSMGVLESYYNEYYLIGKCFSKKELLNMSDNELNIIIKLAGFASDTFY